MAKLTGSRSKAIYKNGLLATAFGTAVAGGTGNRIRANSINPNFTSQELVKGVIGSGLIMQDEIQKGRLTPIVSIAGDAGFNNMYDEIAAQFFSASSAPAEQTASQSDYLHRLTLSADENRIFGTFAYELETTKVAELPSCAVTSFTTSYGQAQEYLQVSAELLGNTLVLNSSTNTNATMNSATFADTECVRVKESDEFYINLQSGGDFSGGDLFKVMSYTRTLTRPQEQMGNIRGVAGNDRPLMTGLPTGTLTVVLEALENINMFTAWDTEAYYKCKMVIEGSQIGTGDNKSWIEYCPRIKLLQAPVYALTNAGYNQVTLNFTLFEASANPTGMDSTRPYLELINTRSAAYIA